MRCGCARQNPRHSGSLKTPQRPDAVQEFADPCASTRSAKPSLKQFRRRLACHQRLLQRRIQRFEFHFCVSLNTP